MVKTQTPKVKREVADVTQREQDVADYVRLDSMIKKAEKELAPLKERFAEVALQVARAEEAAGTPVQTLRFVGPDDSAVLAVLSGRPVQMAPEQHEGFAAALGPEVAPDVLETKTTVTLSGDAAQWFLDNYVNAPAAAEASMRDREDVEIVTAHRVRGDFLARRPALAADHPDLSDLLHEISRAGLAKPTIRRG